MGASLLVFERDVKPFRSFCDREMVLGQMFNDPSSGSTDRSGGIYLYFLEPLDILGWGPVTDCPCWCLRSSECQSSETSPNIVGIWWPRKGERDDGRAKVRFWW